MSTKSVKFGLSFLSSVTGKGYLQLCDTSAKVFESSHYLSST